MKQATHTGECQICGRRQMLPDGVLAKHGYTTKWGFFSGVCAGSGHLPFEQSMDQIASAVERVKVDMAGTGAEIQSRETLGCPMKPMVNIYAGGYLDVEAVVTMGEPRVYGDTEPGEQPRTCYSATYTTVQKYWCGLARESKHYAGRIEAYEKAWDMPTLAHWELFVNTKYSQRALRPLNASRHDWMLWQAQRTAKWAPKPLTPRKG